VGVETRNADDEVVPGDRDGQSEKERVVDVPDEAAHRKALPVWTEEAPEPPTTDFNE
jgi:hypothetical protein